MASTPMTASQMFDFERFEASQDRREAVAKVGEPDDPGGLEEAVHITASVPLDKPNSAASDASSPHTSRHSTPEPDPTPPSPNGEELVKAKKIGVKGPKTFAVPVERGSYQTFIDHDSELDPEGYPFLPNGLTTFVREPGQVYKNWGTFAFTYKTTGGGLKEGCDWRLVRFHCLGVILCEGECGYRGSPPTGKKKIPEWLAK